MEGEDLREVLNTFNKVDYWLGGNKTTLQAVISLLDNVSDGKEFTIIDVGCGGGAQLRTIAAYASGNNLNLNLIGIDANNFTINYAKEWSPEFSNISYYNINLFDKEFESMSSDIIICALTLHHFSDSEILKLLQSFKRQARQGIVINDLHRSMLAYRLFQAFCFIFRINRTSRKDGLTSILRGFKRRELIAFAEQLNFKRFSINWKWAFRYQFIIITK